MSRVRRGGEESEGERRSGEEWSVARESEEAEGERSEGGEQKSRMWRSRYLSAAS